jgi:autotransporter-associated beta strand protein
VVTGLLLLLPNARAQFTWPVYEPFGEYTNTFDLGGGDSTNYWNFGNGGGAGVASYVITNAAAMTYPALLPETNPVPAGVASVPVLNTSADVGAVFTTNLGTIYVSFLFNYIDNGASVTTPGDRIFFQLVPDAPTTNDGGSFTHVWTDIAMTPDYRLMIDKDVNNNGAYSGTTAVLSTNVTHLIVISYQTNKVVGAPDTMNLWVDPAPFGNNASIPPPTLTTTNGPNITNALGVAEFNGFVLDSRAAPTYTANLFYIDEIRVNNNWAGVTPLATPVPGPLFSMTGGGTSCGTPEDVGLNGSVTTNVYLLYTNGVYTGVTLAGTGSALDYGLQGTAAYYSVLASNINTAYVGWMSNSVTVAVVQPPVIGTEPKPVIAATNNRAAFTVAATGDTLTYQWYDNGNPLTNDSHLTGATTNALVISPVTTADIGNYYCSVMDLCGNTIYTTTNSLSLDAPSNLEWTGDAFNVDIWDVATTPDWNDGLVFNPGDNVTFDDTYTYATPISLNGVLTPTSITVNAARNYIWQSGTQGGYITGSAELVKSGTGSLLVNNEYASSYLNSYAGGTVINEGTINMSNSWSLLGSGAVTLAGGTLESYQKGNGTSTGLTNTVFVTANSVWQVDRTGSQCGGIIGPLIGNPGTTLTISNNVTTVGTNRVYFGGQFTNNSAIVLSAYLSGGAVEFAPVNSTGIEIFNGGISGSGQFTQVGAGAVYLNGVNTYSGPTTNSAGFLGGSGSVSGWVFVVSGATLGGGPANSIGTFTINSNLTLNGNVLVRVNKSLAQSNDLVSVIGTITNGGAGTITVTNIGVPALAAGDSFRIFSEAVSNGAALTVTGGGGGVSWTNELAINGSIQVLTATASYPTNISYTVSPGMVTITWPATHLGWILQSQTNSLNLGLSNAWYDIANTATVTSTNLTVNPENPAVFYRLRHP